MQQFPSIIGRNIVLPCEHWPPRNDLLYPATVWFWKIHLNSHTNDKTLIFSKIQVTLKASLEYLERFLYCARVFLGGRCKVTRKRPWSPGSHVLRADTEVLTKPGHTGTRSTRPYTAKGCGKRFWHNLCVAPTLLPAHFTYCLSFHHCNLSPSGPSVLSRLYQEALYYRSPSYNEIHLVAIELLLGHRCTQLALN